MASETWSALLWLQRAACSGLPLYALLPELLVSCRADQSQLHQLSNVHQPILQSCTSVRLQTRMEVLRITVYYGRQGSSCCFPNNHMVFRLQALVRSRSILRLLAQKSCLAILCAWSLPAAAAAMVLLSLHVHMFGHRLHHTSRNRHSQCLT